MDVLTIRALFFGVYIFRPLTFGNSHMGNGSIFRGRFQDPLMHTRDHGK